MRGNIEATGFELLYVAVATEQCDQFHSEVGCGSEKLLLPHSANCQYREIASSNTSRLEAHVGFFQIAYEGDFRSLCTVTF